MNGRGARAALPTPVLTGVASLQLDRNAREAAAVPEPVLMENAGRAAAHVVAENFPEGSILVLVGSGHNGGDALVAARTLHCWGRDVACVRVAAGEVDSSLLHGHDVRFLDDARAAEALARAAVIVDGMLGTGFAGTPREPVATWIRRVNDSGRPVVSLDLPSGLDATSGAAPAAVIAATITVTFGVAKQGLFFQQGRRCAGRILVVEIGFPPVPADVPVAGELITHAWAVEALPQRDPRAHKNSEGRVLIAAGSEAYGGAAVLAALGALRCGAGIVRVLSADANRELLLRRLPEAIFLDRNDREAIADAASAADAVVLGPGLGLDDAARALFDAVTATGTAPLLLDADALTMAAKDVEMLTRLSERRPVVLTPHPGEMARLTSHDVDRIRDFPVEHARELAERTGCVVLLKGAPSVVAAAGCPTRVNTTGSSDLAKAGMGDLLSGCVGAFLGRGAAPLDAAALGLFMTGLAADQLALGVGLDPTDVAEALPRALAAVPPRSSPGLPFVTFDQRAPH